MTPPPAPNKSAPSNTNSTPTAKPPDPSTDSTAPKPKPPSATTKPPTTSPPTASPDPNPRRTHATPFPHRGAASTGSSSEPPGRCQQPNTPAAASARPKTLTCPYSVTYASATPQTTTGTPSASKPKRSITPARNAAYN